MSVRRKKLVGEHATATHLHCFAPNLTGLNLGQRVRTGGLPGVHPEVDPAMDPGSDEQRVFDSESQYLVQEVVHAKESVKGVSKKRKQATASMQEAIDAKALAAATNKQTKVDKAILKDITQEVADAATEEKIRVELINTNRLIGLLRLQGKNESTEPKPFGHITKPLAPGRRGELTTQLQNSYVKVMKLASKNDEVREQYKRDMEKNLSILSDIEDMKKEAMPFIQRHIKKKLQKALNIANQEKLEKQTLKDKKKREQEVRQNAVEAQKVAKKARVAAKETARIARLEAEAAAQAAFEAQEECDFALDRLHRLRIKLKGMKSTFLAHRKVLNEKTACKEMGQDAWMDKVEDELTRLNKFLVDLEASDGFNWHLSNLGEEEGEEESDEEGEEEGDEDGEEEGEEESEGEDEFGDLIDHDIDWKSAQVDLFVKVNTSMAPIFDSDDTTIMGQKIYTSIQNFIKVDKLVKEFGLQQANVIVYWDSPGQYNVTFLLTEDMINQGKSAKPGELIDRDRLEEMILNIGDTKWAGWIGDPTAEVSINDYTIPPYITKEEEEWLDKAQPNWIYIEDYADRMQVVDTARLALLRSKADAANIDINIFNPTPLELESVYETLKNYPGFEGGGFTRDWYEDKVQRAKFGLDDDTVLPLLKQVREKLGERSDEESDEEEDEDEGEEI